MNSMICPYCGNLITYNSFFDVFYCLKCGGFFKQATVTECNDLNKPLTNAQKIRAMSDKELAELMRSMMDCDSCGNMFSFKCDGSYEHCLSVCLEWLQQPAEEDDYVV